MIIGNTYRISAFQLLLCTVPVLWLWFVLVNHLRIEWTLNPQYGYGWAVPFLSVFLLWKRLQQPPPPVRRMAWQRWLFSDRFLLVAFGALALAYFPTRMIQEANPDWRLVSWGLAVLAAGSALAMLLVSRRRGRALTALGVSGLLVGATGWAAMEYGQRRLQQPLTGTSGSVRAMADAMVSTATAGAHQWLNVTLIIGGGLVIVGVIVSLLSGLASASGAGTKTPART